MMQKQFFKSKRLFLLFAGLLVLASCSNPLLSGTAGVPWDTTFTIGGIQFPNDSIAQRSVVSTGSLWRLKGFIQKCQTLRTVTIGFIGGSITAGALASKPDLRFSSLFCTYMYDCFPNLKNVNEINAGIGATNSRFGCSRIQEDLLSFGPDLIVIEFAVNDAGMGDDVYIKSCVEGLVRQCFFYNNNVPVMLLFMPGVNGVNVQDLHIDVGSYYGLPMISDRDAIWPLIESNRVSQSVFYGDDIHPNDNGHRVCAYLLYSFVKSQVNAVPDAKSAAPPFLYSDMYQYAGTHDAADTLVKVKQSGWDQVVVEKGRLSYQSVPLFTGPSFVIQSRCREITLGVHMQPADTSGIRVTVDGGALDTTLNNYATINYTRFVRVLNSTTNDLHVIRVDHGADAPAFTIDYVLYAGAPD